MADLGGLGARKGPPTIYNWTIPSPLPPLLPWLGILLLLAFKPNRSLQAWWIWLPLGVMSAVAWLLEGGLGDSPSDSLDELVEPPLALVFGLAALWLLAPALRKSHRFLTSLLVLVSLTGFSVATFFVRQGTDLKSAEAIALAVATAVGAAVISVALSLAGLVCRRQYGRVRLCVRLVAALVGLWLMLFGCLFLGMQAFSPGDVPAWVPLAAGGIAVGISCAILLPYLVLGLANGFFRERVQQLLHLEGGPALLPIIPDNPHAGSAPALGS